MRERISEKKKKKKVKMMMMMMMNSKREEQVKEVALCFSVLLTELLFSLHSTFAFLLSVLIETLFFLSLCFCLRVDETSSFLLFFFLFLDLFFFLFFRNIIYIRDKFFAYKTKKLIN